MHALCTVVGLKMLWDTRTPSEMVEAINQRLPDDIKVIATKVVTNGFNAKFCATFRVYEYLFPYQSLFPGEQFTVEKIKELNNITKLLEGTHSFHNYTRRLEHTSPEAKRYIIKFEVSPDPIQYNELQFMKFNITGQSFLYHQIRKMIGMSLSVLAGKFPKEKIEESFIEPQLDISLAPAEGLALSRIHFQQYNRKQAHKAIILSDEEERSVQDFYTNSIVQSIFSAEKVFTEWCEQEFRSNKTFE